MLIGGMRRINLQDRLLLLAGEAQRPREGHCGCCRGGGYFCSDFILGLPAAELWPVCCTWSYRIAIGLSAIAIGLSAAGSCQVKAVANVAAGDPRSQPPLQGRQRRLEWPARADWL
jgi:hypothetical protein